MRSKKKQPNGKDTAPIYLAIKAPSPGSDVQPGDVGRDAVAAATLQHLTRYARDVQQYLNASKLTRLLNGIQADMESDPPAPQLHLQRGAE